MNINYAGVDSLCLILKLGMMPNPSNCHFIENMHGSKLKEATENYCFWLTMKGNLVYFDLHLILLTKLCMVYY